MSGERTFRDVIRDAAPAAAKPPDEFLAELDAFIEAHDPFRVNRVIPAIGEGRASLDVVRRYAKELYYLGRWMTPELALLIANAPDTDALRLEDSEHYLHWSQNFADETGYLGDPNHVAMKVEHCRQLGISDEEILSYAPMPETVGSVFTLLFYMRRSYEEGLAAFGYARERVAGRSGYAGTLYSGLSKHYGMQVKNYAVHAYAESDHGDKAAELLRKVIGSGDVQRRVRQAVEHTILTNESRSHALNRWLEEPGALREPPA
jgi:pyrroloquinoline quinone (PQQ) biosynthesis protein C